MIHTIKELRQIHIHSDSPFLLDDLLYLLYRLMPISTLAGTAIQKLCGSFALPRSSVGIKPSSIPN